MKLKQKLRQKLKQKLRQKKEIDYKLEGTFNLPSFTS